MYKQIPSMRTAIICDRCHDEVNDIHGRNQFHNLCDWLDIKDVHLCHKCSELLTKKFVRELKRIIKNET